MNMQLILRELMPRLIGVMLVALSAIMAGNAFSDKARQNWEYTLQKTTADASEFAHKWLSEKTEALESLVEDSRILSVFYEPEAISLARTALYEFGNVQKTDGVYLFDIELGDVIVKRAGAPNLSPTAIDFLSAAHDEGWTRIAFFIKSETGEQLMAFASIIRGDIGDIIGYAIYTLPYKAAIQSLRSPNVKGQPLKLSLYRMTKSDLTDTVYNYNTGESAYVLIGKKQTNLPVFSANTHTSIYSDLATGQPMLTHITELAHQQHWLISTAVPYSYISTQEEPSLKIIYLTALTLSLILLLVPTKGPYSRMLKRGYAKLIPTVEGATSNETSINIPEIDPNDIIKNTKQKDTVPTDKTSKFINPREVKTEKSTLVGYNSSSHFVGKARENGFGTNVGDTKPLEIRTVTAPKNTEKTTRKETMEFIIRQGIRDEHFKLLYQPIFNVKTGKPVMYEVLCRILDDAGEVIPPPVWLPVVRKDNLFQNIDKGVINQATTQHIFCKNPLDIPLSFNLSGGTFDSLSFMESLMEKMVDRPDLASMMMFELSSKEIIQDQKALKFIRECRELGFKFSIDYFGGGVKTLEAAKKLKFDFMKVDALKFDLYAKDDQKLLVQLLITANKIKLPLIIERIEHQAFYNLIQKIGAPYAQGYLLGEPSEHIKF